MIEQRNNFVNYFTKHKDKYYCGYNDVNNNTAYNIPIREKRILLAHDESTFRSGEMSEYRWLFPKFISFFNKGRGRSIMISGFIVQHSESDIFMLDEDEWNQTVSVYPELNSADDFLNYFPRSANAWIETKKDNYFDNTVILRQFERLLQLIKFKKSYVDHRI